MTITTFEQLLTPIGQLLLSEAMRLEPTEKTFLGTYEVLRKRGSPELVKAAVEQAILRRKARAKFSDADQMYFTRESLEQSTSQVVADYRATRFKAFDSVADFCCGIGGDARALSRVVPHVIAVDQDALKVRIAQENAPKATVVLGDVLKIDLPRVDAIFCDPSRRSDGQRMVSATNYLPSPFSLFEKYKHLPIAFKLAPAVPLEELDSIAGEREFLSRDGELKECVLWTGKLATARLRSTCLPSGLTIAADRPDASPDIRPIARYLLDPDPSLTRSGLLSNYAHAITANLIDPALAFLTADHASVSPWATIYEVQDVIPFHVRRTGDWLRTNGFGRVTIVKRGSSANADALLKVWKLKGERHADLILTRANGSPVAIVAQRLGTDTTTLPNS